MTEIAAGPMPFRTAAAAFTGTVARLELLAGHLLDPVRRNEVILSLEAIQQQARSEYEVVRLLLEDRTTQEYGKRVLRQSYVLRRVAIQKGIHPRSEASGWSELQADLKRFLVGVRKELHLKNPDDVFVEPPDWQAWLK